MYTTSHVIVLASMTVRSIVMYVPTLTYVRTPCPCSSRLPRSLCGGPLAPGLSRPAFLKALNNADNFKWFIYYLNFCSDAPTGVSHTKCKAARMPPPPPLPWGLGPCADSPSKFLKL